MLNCFCWDGLRFPADGGTSWVAAPGCVRLDKIQSYLVLPPKFKRKSPGRSRHMPVLGINLEDKFSLSRWGTCKA